MRMTIFHWLDREFVALSAEGKAGLTPQEEMRELLLRFDEALRAFGLSLDDTVRTRIWARDREARDQAAAERLAILSGKRRSASSSYISASHFDSDARSALDLLAMRPARPDAEKVIKEYEPPRVPPRYVVYDPIVFLSGWSVGLPTLVEQVPSILRTIHGSLEDAGTSWDKVVEVACYLQREQELSALREMFRETVRVEAPRLVFAFVDGYAGRDDLLEIEVTATQ